MHSSRMRTVRNRSRLLGGVPGPGGCVPGLGGAPAQVPPRGQTDRCKNITFATLLRTVITDAVLLFIDDHRK